MSKPIFFFFKKKSTEPSIFRNSMKISKYFTLIFPSIQVNYNWWNYKTEVFFCGKVGLEVYKGRFNVCLFETYTIIFPWWKCDRIVDNIQSRLNVLISLCDQHCNAKKWQCKEAHNDFKRYSHCARRYTKVITLHGKGKNIIEWKKKPNFK